MKTTRSIIYRLALCAILLATSLLTACTTRMTVTPVAAIATLEPMADGREDSSDANDANDATTRSQPVATATESATETPSASPTPLPPQPPKLVSREPEHGQELQLGQPLTLVFDQPMDRASVGSAFATAPDLLGPIT